MASLITNKFRTFTAQQLLEAVEEHANTAYYVYVGVHGNVIGEIPTPSDDEREVSIDSYRNMIFGKRVNVNDVSLLVRYIPWEVNKVFDMYDDNDKEILTKDFFCSVDEGSFIHTYKCLNNNFGGNSTIEPSFVFVNENSHFIFETSDGYVWKYMYSVSNTVRDKFITANFFPVTDNANVQADAVPGAVDVIRIEQNDLDIPGGGKGYNNYLTGTFSTAELRVNGNNLTYAITNTNISHDIGYYTGCLLYISGGIGSGQYSTITNYYHNSNGNFIVIDSAFSIPPVNGTTYEIYPEVIIRGSGTQTVNAVARGLVNATGSNSIYKVEILERGAGYDYITANVIANSVIIDDINFVAAELHPIYSPGDGHGSNCAIELGSKHIEFSMQFANSENGTLLTENRYQQIGLLKDPAFANIVVSTTNTAGIFMIGESIYKIDPVRINSNVNISNTSSVITGEMSILSNAQIVSSGVSGSYIPSDILDIEGGTSLSNAQVKVLTTHVRSATINAAGSGYTPGQFTANLNLGTATTNAVFTATANSLGECESIVITNPGVFTGNPPYLANSTPVGGDGTGLTVSINMGLEEIEIFNLGSYAIIPTDLATNEPIANTGDGVGAELLITFVSTLSADFLNQVSPGDYVYFTSTNLLQQQLAVVNSVTNATHMEITVNGFFSCSSAWMYLPNITSSAEILDAANTTTVIISDVDQEIGTNDLIVGISSGAKFQVNTITRNSIEKNFDSFVQLYKYDVSVLSDVFNENEYVYQGNSLANSTASALIHSIVTSGEITYMYTSNQVGQFDTSTMIQGANSLAVGTINSKWSPELKFGSGEILYLENIEAVNRANDQTERFQIIVGF